MQCIHFSRNLCSVSHLSHGNYKIYFLYIYIIKFPKPNSNLLLENNSNNPNNQPNPNTLKTRTPHTQDQNQSGWKGPQEEEGWRNGWTDYCWKSTVMQKSMMRSIQLLACCSAVKHNIHLHCTNTDIQDSCTLPQLLWKKGMGQDEPVQDTGCKKQLGGEWGEHVREE